jgi:hypothetical protein
MLLDFAFENACLPMSAPEYAPALTMAPLVPTNAQEHEYSHFLLSLFLPHSYLFTGIGRTKN